MRPGSESQPTRPVSCGQTAQNHAMKGTPLGTSPCSKYPICDMQILQWGPCNSCQVSACPLSSDWTSVFQAQAPTCCADPATPTFYGST